VPATFPTFPIRDVRITIEREQPAAHFVGASGRRVSTSYRTAPTRYIRMAFPLLRDNVTAEAPWQAYSEVGALRAAYAQTFGELGTLQLADPEGGAAITVSFDGELSITKNGAHEFEAEVELVEVL
jgi:hypothetical protein